MLNISSLKLMAVCTIILVVNFIVQHILRTIYQKCFAAIQDSCFYNKINELKCVQTTRSMIHLSICPSLIRPGPSVHEQAIRTKQTVVDHSQ